MDKLIKALKKAVPNISDDAVNSIQSIFESAVDAKAQEKVENLTGVIDQYIDTVSGAIKTSISEELSQTLQDKAEAVEEEVRMELQESFDEKMDELVEGLDRYVTHTANTYIEENKKEIMDEALVEQADSIVKVVGSTILSLGQDIVQIQEGKQGNSKVVESAIKAKEKAEKEATIATNKLALTEKLVDLDIATRSKLSNIMEAELSLPTDTFIEKLDTMATLVESKLGGSDRHDRNSHHKRTQDENRSKKRKITI